MVWLWQVLSGIRIWGYYRVNSFVVLDWVSFEILREFFGLLLLNFLKPLFVQFIFNLVCVSHRIQNVAIVEFLALVLENKTNTVSGLAVIVWIKILQHDLRGLLRVVFACQPLIARKLRVVQVAFILDLMLYASIERAANELVIAQRQNCSRHSLVDLQCLALCVWVDNNGVRPHIGVKTILLRAESATAYSFRDWTHFSFIQLEKCLLVVLVMLVCLNFAAENTFLWSDMASFWFHLIEWIVGLVACVIFR